MKVKGSLKRESERCFFHQNRRLDFFLPSTSTSDHPPPSLPPSLPPFLHPLNPQFYARHLAQGTRPDGRAPTEARSLSISLGAIGGGGGGGGSGNGAHASGDAPCSLAALLSSPPCDGSALVRCGGTAAVAAVTFEVAAASELAPAAGALSVAVDLPPLCAAWARPGGGAGARGGPERLRGLAASVLSDLRACASVDEAGGALCIRRGVAVFVARVDVSFLSCDGGERGVALLAAAAALADARLPLVEISGGNVVRAGGGVKGGESGGRGAGGGGGGATTTAAAAEPSTPSSPFPSGLLLRSLPVASTLATHGASPVFDPDARESELAHSSVTVVVRAGDGALLGVEGGVRRSASVGNESGNDGGGESSSSSNSSSFAGVVPLSVIRQAALLGRARAAEAAEALSAALEAKRKGKS